MHIDLLELGHYQVAGALGRGQSGHNGDIIQLIATSAHGARQLGASGVSGINEQVELDFRLVALYAVSM